MHARGPIKFVEPQISLRYFALYYPSRILLDDDLDIQGFIVIAQKGNALIILHGPGAEIGASQIRSLEGDRDFNFLSGCYGGCERHNFAAHFLTITKDQFITFTPGTRTD